jgi:hypothetical protein
MDIRWSSNDETYLAASYCLGHRPEQRRRREGRAIPLPILSATWYSTNVRIVASQTWTQNLRVCKQQPGPMRRLNRAQPSGQAVTLEQVLQSQ